MLIAALSFLVGIALAAPDAAPERAEVVLDDGQVLVGVVAKEADGSVVITLGSGTTLRFPAAAVRAVRAVHEVREDLAIGPKSWDPDPNKSRYLYSPSAFGLGQGRGYISQKQLILTEAAFGVTDWWDIQAGTSIITLLIPGGAVGMVGTKLSLPVANDVRIAAGAQGIFFESGAGVLAFGTGTHETTRLALIAVEAWADTALAQGVDLAKVRVIDVGTGSGILAILAVKMGAGHALGTEVDNVALPSARGNLVLNGVQDRVELRLLPDPSLLAPARYELVIANIISAVLMPLRDSLVQRMAPGATLILSGILWREVDEVREHYGEAGVVAIDQSRDGEWASLTLRAA